MTMHYSKNLDRKVAITSATIVLPVYPIFQAEIGGTIESTMHSWPGEKNTKRFRE